MGAFGTLHVDDPQHVGPFRIVARLGEGGMGRVYLGRSKTGRAVAVKVVRPDLAGDHDFRRRFTREVEVARTVSGFFAVEVVAADPHASPPWLATAYVPGVPLDEAVDEYGPWPEASVLALGAGLAEALESIHAAGVVHRDMKPSNVLLSADGPRVIDFGISVQVEASRLTQTGVTVGTPAFMSPEQLVGDPVGPASDVFSLGAVLTFAATGTGPFGAGSLPALVYRVVHQEPDLSTLPPTLRSVVARCLDKRPEYRPTASALLDELAGRITAKGRIIEFFAESAWMPARVGQAVRDRAATPLPDPAEPVPGPAGTPSRPGPAESPGLLTGSAPAFVGPSPRGGRAQGRGAAGHPADGHGAHGLPYPSDGGDPGRGVRARDAVDTLPSRTSRRALLLGLAGVGAAAATGVAAWRIFGGAPETNGPSGPTARSGPTPGDLRWSYRAGTAIDSSPAVADGVVYVGGDDGKVFAIDAATGRERWSFPTGEGPSSSPAVADGVVYVGSGDRKVYALDAATGRKRWTYATRGVVASPAVVDGVLYVGTGDGNVYALDAATGRRRWSFPTGSWIGSSPAVADGVVYVGNGKGGVYAIEAATGRERWSAGISDYVGSSPALGDGPFIYVGGGDGKVYALDAATGRERWTFPTGQPVGPSLTVADDTVYVGAGDGKVYALDAATGRKQWALTTGRGDSATPTVVDGVVYVGGDGGRVHAIDAATGRKNWSFAAGDDVRSSPAVVDGVVYVGSRDGNVYALTTGPAPGRTGGS